MSMVDRVAGVGLAAFLLLALGALSRAPYAPGSGVGALLRLSWRAPASRVQQCRAPTEEELRGLPTHMQRREICEGRVLPYLLQVRVDGRPVARDTVRAAGARGDRPLYVYAEIPIAPGRHRLEVSFARLSELAAESPPEGVEGSEEGEMTQEAAGALPPRMRLDVSAVATAGDVILITYDSEGDSLALRRRGERALR